MLNQRIEIVFLIKPIFSSGFQLKVYRIDGKLSEGEATFHYDGTLSGHEGDILCIDHNGGELVGTGSTDRTVKVWHGMARNRSLNMVRRWAAEGT